MVLENDEKEVREYKVEDLRFRPKKRRERVNLDDAELRELENLEKREGKSRLDGE